MNPPPNEVGDGRSKQVQDDLLQLCLQNPLVHQPVCQGTRKSLSISCFTNSRVVSRSDGADCQFVIWMDRGTESSNLSSAVGKTPEGGISA